MHTTTATTRVSGRLSIVHVTDRANTDLPPPMPEPQAVSIAKRLLIADGATAASLKTLRGLANIQDSIVSRHNGTRRSYLVRAALCVAYHVAMQAEDAL